MGTYFDLGRPVIGGWMGGGWVSRDPVRAIDLLWGGEFGQEGACLFAVNVDTGKVGERHRIGCREFNVTVEHDTGRLWIHTYHGLFEPGLLLWSWSPETRRLESHGFPPLRLQRFAGDTVRSGGRIYIGTHPHGHLVSYEPTTRTWRDHGPQAPGPIVPDQHIWCYPSFAAESGEIICGITRDPAAQVAYDPDTGVTRVLDQLPEKPPEPESSVSRKIEARFRREFSYEVDGELRTTDYEPCVATDICGLQVGPGGRIYGATIISMHVFCYDPATSLLTDLGQVGWSGGEVYDVIGHGGKVYMGSYGGGYWAAYDPDEPWNPCPQEQGMTPEANPRNFGQLGEDMNRPFEYTIGPDDRIYIACRSNYRIPGGGLARFDPRTEEKKVFRDEEQSVQCVASDDRYVYGGTSIRGGRGCVDVTEHAKLFLHSPDEERRVFECIPDPDAIAIGNLAVSPTSRLLYGSTDTGVLFAFDREELQVVKRWQLRSNGTPLMGVPEAYGIIHLTAGHDGDIYGCTQRDVFKLDVATERVEYLDQPPISDLYQIVEGEPGVFYLGARGHLLQYHLKDTPHYR